MLIKPILKNDVQYTEDLEQIQFDLLGISFKDHPMIKVKESYKGEYQIQELNKISEDPNEVSHVLVLLVSHRVVKTKTGLAMAFVKIEDETKIIDAVVFPGIYEKHKSMLINGKMFIVTLKSSPRGFQALAFKEYSNE
jgi:DNA polymerase-3 subunit alpha